MPPEADLAVPLSLSETKVRKIALHHALQNVLIPCTVQKVRLAHRPIARHAYRSLKCLEHEA